MTAALAESRRWMTEGSGLFIDTARDCGTDLDTASVLPGWSRRHVLAHVAANATALGNLVRWAATGVPSPMYATPQDRWIGIDRGLHLDDEKLITVVRRSADELTEAVAGLAPDRWTAQVVTAQGRMVPASIVPWLRTREVYVHAVDLAAGPTFAEVPADVLDALCTDVVIKRSTSPGPALRVESIDVGGPYEIKGEGHPVTVTGSLDGVTAYLTGRDTRGVRAAEGRLPRLPPWL